MVTCESEVRRLRYLLVRLVELEAQGRDGEMKMLLRQHGADAYAALRADPDAHETKFARHESMGAWLLSGDVRPVE